MIPVERQQQILHLLAERGAVSITELTERLQVSHMTIRRDIQKLEEQGRVLSVSGGVSLSERIKSEPSHATKRSLMQERSSPLRTVPRRRWPRAAPSIWMRVPPPSSWPASWRRGKT